MAKQGVVRTARNPDPLTPAQRSRNMSRIRARDTKPELLLRRALHAAGLRYRLHDHRLPGTPDLVLPGRRAVIFVHGCFWHGHNCPKGVTPGTNTLFWTEKIARNRERDARTDNALVDAGWRVITIWECAIRGIARHDLPNVVHEVFDWLEGNDPAHEITGRWPSGTNEA
ncbi:very short patch repair endonuclease [Sphingomonas sp. ERG5]|uniref:very short patch repair endonuclease n=1 Tax=Sphingomonas sp. ERG5 TaxID=1381597 RepID=UPI000689C389|nr:very short patch repair endonuclease [Sphingomonas sp. ERG5]